MLRRTSERLASNGIEGSERLVGGLCGIGSLYYSRRQTNIVVQDYSARKRQSEDDDVWAQRFDKVQTRLLRINPRLQMQEPGNNELTNVYMTMFSDQRLRLDVETTIIIRIQTRISSSRVLGEAHSSAGIREKCD
jgi:hypothetical protein